MKTKRTKIIKRTKRPKIIKRTKRKLISKSGGGNTPLIIGGVALFLFILTIAAAKNKINNFSLPDYLQRLNFLNPGQPNVTPSPTHEVWEGIHNFKP